MHALSCKCTLMSPLRTHPLFSRFPQLSPSPLALLSLRAPATCRPDHSRALLPRASDRDLQFASCDFAILRVAILRFCDCELRLRELRAPCTLLWSSFRAFAPPKTVSGPNKTRFRCWHGRRISPVEYHAFVSLAPRDRDKRPRDGHSQHLILFYSTF